jgi:hypothetical protein
MQAKRQRICTDLRLRYGADADAGVTARRNEIVLKRKPRPIRTTMDGGIAGLIFQPHQSRRDGHNLVEAPTDVGPNDDQAMTRDESWSTCNLPGSLTERPASAFSAKLEE